VNGRTGATTGALRAVTERRKHVDTVLPHRLASLLGHVQKKSASPSAFVSLRFAFALLFCAAVFSILTGTLPAFHSKVSVRGSQRTLTFAERVVYQRAIEEVYWRHRIWPKERPDPKPSLAAVMSQTQLEKKVEDYLHKSQALEDYWQRPITPEQLQAEMDRMGKHTKDPEVLQELFGALGNDPFIIAECLARPALAERLLTDWYAFDDRIHGELRRRLQAELQAHSTVEQMKQTSGAYREIEITRSDSTHEESKRGPESEVKLNNREWDETIQRLTATFHGPTAPSTRVPGIEDASTPAHAKSATAEACQTISIGKVSGLQQDEGHFYATAVIAKGKDHLKFATVSWSKERLESWMARAGNRMPGAVVVPTTSYAFPAISATIGGCSDDTWTPVSNVPSGRAQHTAIWTGSEMIVWGGLNYGIGLDTGDKYNPATDTWSVTTTTNAPEPRSTQTAVWTGTEMIIWGGYGFLGYLNTGGRYNPTTDTWTATSAAGVPTARSFHTAIWTGSEMIVWGGVGDLSTGGRYNPSTDSGAATSITNAPVGRFQHTAIWSGNEMIVWGGDIDGFGINTGGRYNPVTE